VSFGRWHPRSIQPSDTEGDRLTTVGGVVAWAPDAPSGVQSLVEGDNVTIDDTDPEHPVISVALLVPWTTTVNGVPDLVWDSNDELVLIEVDL
jgi:hypothetical protein